MSSTARGRNVATDLSTKAAQRKLRELAGRAYARELGSELAKLEMEFSRWRGGEIDPFELSDRIHRFHDGISRDLWVSYHRGSPHILVARAIAYKVLDRAEIPSEILMAIEPAIEIFVQGEQKDAVRDDG